MVVVVRLRQLAGEAAAVEGVALPLLQLALPLLQLAHSVAQRVLLLLRLLPFLPFQQRPRLRTPRMRMRQQLQLPAVEAAVQDVVVAAEVEGAQLLRAAPAPGPTVSLTLHRSR